MNEPALGPRNVAAAAVLLGGVLMVALPRHALSIVQLVMVTSAVSAGVYALAVNVPTSGWISPFQWLSPFSRAAHPSGPGHRWDTLGLIQAQLAERRQRLEGAPPLPPAVLRHLKVLIAGALELDPADEAGLEAARGEVSDLTFAVLTSRPLPRPTWLGTVRPDRRRTAQAVHRVLDDLDRLAQGHPPHPSNQSPEARVP